MTETTLEHWVGDSARGSRSKLLRGEEHTAAASDKKRIAAFTKNIIAEVEGFTPGAMRFDIVMLTA